ncbi:MAG: aminoacyl-histidine dipeptidase [Muribaculaceae bacterium]|nr:aminoacyl-histidine dipeptidase [Muribaculaceae bacterium]
MDIKDLKPALIWNIFDQITKVPRPSKKEGKIREFLIDFAKKNNITAKTDNIGNVLMTKPASAGCEKAPVIILQGHMDMVCEKNNDVKHDFDNDPITTVVEGEWVRANGTTLGADNGIGMAAALAVLVDDSLTHGPIKALFTVDEETGLTGAVNLGEGMIDGDILLNLDSEDEAEIFIGCAGGIDTTATFKYKKSISPENFQYFKVDFTGMHGGHSGTDIDKGRANANKLMARFLWEIMQRVEITIAKIHGGNLRNAIAREASVVVGIHTDLKEDLRIQLNNLIAYLEEEYKGIENLKITLESVKTPDFCIDSDTSIALVRALYGCPHGVISMCADIPGLVETSTNLASVKMIEDNQILVTTSQRSSVESRKYDIANQVEAVFQLAGANVTHGDGYPGWAPNVNSKILKTAIKAYEDLYDITPAAKALHAGLECGYFLKCYPNLDMISFGPTLLDVHSPKERMHIPAVDKFWNHLVKILAMVAKETK